MDPRRGDPAPSCLLVMGQAGLRLPDLTWISSSPLGLRTWPAAVRRAVAALRVDVLMDGLSGVRMAGGGIWERRRERGW